MSLIRVLHWGPLMALAIIKVISFTTLFVTSMWLSPLSSLPAFLNHILFLALVASSLYGFFMALLKGPGFIPFGWKPKNEDDCQYLQFCILCQGYKPPRAHHCRKCQRCVMKMDHHCPWINTCCGHLNHAHFVIFLLASVVGAIHATILLSMGLYKAFHLSWYLYHGQRDQIVYLSLLGYIMVVFSVGLAVGVILAVGGLLFIQAKIILRNETSIENWIVVKAQSTSRRPQDKSFVYPYNLGWKNNFLSVFWDPIGDGIHWNVSEGSSQYDLTIEQLEQKKEKRGRTVHFTAIQPYSGSWLPLSKGLRVCLNFPCTDEPRIPLSVGDRVSVTRWRKHWLYGEVMDSDGTRGWFPRCCAVEFTSPDCNINRMSKKLL